MPDYVSNYFPLADAPLTLGSVSLTSHDLRVPLIPFERAKFAWSSYAGEVQLFLHTDSVLVDSGAMTESLRAASSEVLSHLREKLAGASQ